MRILLLLSCFVSSLGFVLGYSAYCDHAFLGRQGEGIIRSYNYPFNYRQNLTCTYRIYVNNDETDDTKTICFTFHRFQLENSTLFCSFDYMKFGDTKYCGSGLWQIGVPSTNQKSNVWSNNFCWIVKGGWFDIHFISDTNINSAGFYATFKVYDGAGSIPTVSAGSVGRAPCPVGKWTCFNRNCITQSLLCNGEDDCGDGTDESYAHARCGEQNVLACDFSTQGGVADGYCGFNHDGWYRTNKRSPYGPRGDHTNTTHGFYVYTDVNQSAAYLVSPEVTLPHNRVHCLSFWYYVYGRPAAAILRVYIRRDQAYSRPEWSRATAAENQWLRGEMTISTNAPLQVIFAAELGNSFSGVALDDISVLEGQCLGDDVACNFESGPCSWTNVKRIQHKEGTLYGDLTWRIHSRILSAVGPFWDRSSKDGGGYYLYVNASSSDSSESRALLYSREVSMLPGEQKCLHFWYFMLGSDSDCCLLRVRVHGSDDVINGATWSQHGTIRNTWQQAHIDLNVGAPFKIVLEGVIKSGSRGEIAIDEILLQGGKCKTESVSACETGQYLCLNGNCINETQKCDGHADCEDKSDEDWKAGCPTAPPASGGPCRASHYRCLHDGSCILKSWLCDGFNDCGDNSDENELAGCSGSTTPVALIVGMRCQSDEYRCKAGGCVPVVRLCDGQQDCTDGSDEDRRANCTEGSTHPVSTCTAAEFSCATSGICIAKSLVCNGEADCKDGSDEDSSVVPCTDAAAPVALGVGAACGIAVACVLVILAIVVIVIVLLRRKKRSPPNSSHSLPSVSEGMMQRHLSMLASMREPMRARPPPYTERYVDNSGFTLETLLRRRNERASNDSAPASSDVPLEEPPPPYDSVMKEDNEISETNIHHVVSSSSCHQLAPDDPDSAAQAITQTMPAHSATLPRAPPGVHIEGAATSQRRPSQQITRTPSVHNRSRSDPSRGHVAMATVSRTIPGRIRLGTQALPGRTPMYHMRNYYNSRDHDDSSEDHMYESIPAHGFRSGGPVAVAPPPPLPVRPPDSTSPVSRTARTRMGMGVSPFRADSAHMGVVLPHHGATSLPQGQYPRMSPTVSDAHTTPLDVSFPSSTRSFSPDHMTTDQHHPVQPHHPRMGSGASHGSHDMSTTSVVYNSDIETSLLPTSV